MSKIFRTLNLAVMGVCAPLSLALFFFWLAFAGGLVVYGDLQDDLRQLYDALFVSVNRGLAFHIARGLWSALGGLVGWMSLVALCFFCLKRRGSTVPQWIKVGCFIGMTAALAAPAAPGVALPPILLCASLFWFDAQRGQPSIAQGGA